MAHVNQARETVGTGVSPAVFIARAVYFIFGAIITFIVLRVVLLLLGANPANAFVDFVYSISAVFVEPFFGVFAYTPTYGPSVIEVTSLIAIITYALVCWGLVSLTTLGSRHRSDV